MNTGKTARKQVPAVAKLIEARGVRWQKGQRPSTNLDIGSGPYTDFSDWLKKRGVVNFPVDANHMTVMGTNLLYQMMEIQAWTDRGGWFDTVTLSNVLNVIETYEDLRSTIKYAADNCHPETLVYATVYEGDRSGEGRKTRDGWQRNQKIREYVIPLEEFFLTVERRGPLIVCWGPKKK